MSSQDELDSLRGRAGACYPPDLRVSPELLGQFAWALDSLSDSARQLPTDEPANTLAEALPMSDTGRACTAASQAFNAAARGISGRLADMAAIASSVSEAYDMTDERFAVEILSLEDLL
ncbi:hypothetical protein IEU95_15955 [Hoyosella rhizosphaerae]|uniref:Uncharacterized protein n=1 Tax=Hoyosella rhizosphaerae TaxID=1755582 RepID=A0A916XJ35_9ACTN|nr:hypothetical protein [Hoyosella rhizosphaerae]MBN4928329.1 hypothetical protein [Hoyosella rhizosphaerae]GGC74128.1 hypothetical protein GCM10011410_29180 [Hoyosella rhizosphaerae]